MIVADISKHLSPFELGIRLRVETGRTLVIVGPSGSGKTTILNCIAGLARPDRGTIELFGDPVFNSDEGIDLPPEHRHVGYVFQDYALFPHLSVFDNVAYGLRARHRPSAEVRPKVEATLEMLQIADLGKERPPRLSGGERQRVALARAIAAESRVLLLDEPLGALDASTRKHVRRELRQLLRRLQITAVVVTHDCADALAFGQRIMVMDQGKAVQEGTRQELLFHPRSRFVADLTGVNYFEGSVLPVGGQPRSVRVGNTVIHAVTDVDGDVALSVLPSEVMLSLEEPHTSARNVLKGTVHDIAHFGDRMRVHIDSAPPIVAEVTAEASRELHIEEGIVVYAFFKATSMRVAD